MIKKVKSINSIFCEVSSYDLVVTNDAPLNTALNKCLDKSIFGNFAMTSKMIYGKLSQREFEDKLLEDVDVVISIFKNSKFNYSLKEAWFYFNEIKTVFRYVSDLDVARSELSKTVNVVLDFILTLNVDLKLEGDFSFFYSSKKVTCVGFDNFDLSDRKVLPNDSNFEKVDLFTDSDFDLGKCYLFDSKKSVIDRVVSMISSENCDGVAVVLDIGSDYLPILKAKLINSGISINEKLNLVDGFRVREFFGLLDLVFSRHNLKVSDVYAISDLFDFDIDEKLFNYNFVEICSRDESCKKFNLFLDSVFIGTFGELFEKFNGISDELSLPFEFSDLLYKLGIYNKKISLEELINLKFIVSNFDITISQERSGVLIVDCNNSSFVNRDVVFYVGMDSNWSRSILKKDYVNYNEEFSRNLNNFKILIQQGVQRFNFTTEFTGGEKTLPPFYFNSIFPDLDIKNFESIFGSSGIERINFNSGVDGDVEKNFGVKVFDEKLLGKEKVKSSTLSNSTLSSFSSCPKKVAYSRLNISYDEEHFTKGNLIHGFCEFYVCHSDFVKLTGLDSFLDIIIDELKFITNNYKLAVLKNEVKFALVSVMEFVDNLHIDSSMDFLGSGTVRSDKNIFCDKFSKKINIDNVEFGFKDKDIKIKGFIDLIVNSCLIVDYKTGKLKTPKDIIVNSDFNNLVSRCDFQAFSYFSILRKYSDSNLVFKYFHPLTNVYNRLTVNTLEKDELILNYINLEFIDYFMTCDFFDWIMENSTKYIGDMLKILKNFDVFSDNNLSRHDFDDIDNLNLKFHSVILESLINGGIKNKTEKQQQTNIDNVYKFLKFIFDFKNSFVRSQKEVFYFKDDVDSFEKFVSISLQKYNDSVAEVFDYRPAEGEETCEKCEFKAICLKKFDRSCGGGF